MSCGQVRGLSWRKLIRCIGDLGAQILCRLFLLVQALIFAALAGSLDHFSGRCVLCLAVLVRSCLAELVPVTAGFGTLVGRSTVMDLLPGRDNRLQKHF